MREGKQVESGAWQTPLLSKLTKPGQAKLTKQRSSNSSHSFSYSSDNNCRSCSLPVWLPTLYSTLSPTLSHSNYIAISFCCVWPPTLSFGHCCSCHNYCNWQLSVLYPKLKYEKYPNWGYLSSTYANAVRDILKPAKRVSRKCAKVL